MKALPPHGRMSNAPRELRELLRADGPSSARRAWERFVRVHSRLLLEATRSLDAEYDSSMDRYAFVLEKLKEDDFRRLRSFQADGRAKFTTWLVVVVKRLCIDHHRSQYGREEVARGSDPPQEGRALMRRRLVDLIGHGDVDELADPRKTDAESRLIRSELIDALDEELAALDHRDRLLLSLRFEDDATAREIHQVMGFRTPKHVYRRLYRLLAKLRDALEARGIDGR